MQQVPSETQEKSVTQTALDALVKSLPTELQPLGEKLVWAFRFGDADDDKGASEFALKLEQVPAGQQFVVAATDAMLRM